MRIALVRCAMLPEPDPDEAPLLDALGALGHDARSVSWDAPDGSPQQLASFDAAVLRATWNYAQNVDRFTAWLDAAARVTRLLNPLPIVRSNLHKRYLVDLTSMGVPTVPTEFVGRGVRADVRAIAHRHKWSAVVIKPAVSAGSYRTRKFDLVEGEDQIKAAQSFLDDMLHGPVDARDAQGPRDAMIQRFEPAVARGGEVNLVWIDGVVSHAVIKRPRFDGEHEGVTTHERITEEEREFAHRVLDAAGVGQLPAGQRPVFARIDTFRDDAGRLMLSELELIEPSLFFAHGPGAADRLSRAIIARLERN